MQNWPTKDGPAGHAERRPHLRLVQPELPGLLDPAAGAAARDAGIASVGEHNELWANYALACLRYLCTTQEYVHADDLVALLVWQPAHPNAAGAVWMRARKEGLLEPTDRWRMSAVPVKHRRKLPIYRSLLYTSGTGGSGR